MLVPHQNHFWQADKGFEDHLQDLEEIEQQLKGAGIIIPAGSRLDMYRQAILSAALPHLYDSVPTPLFLQRTLTELRELSLIVLEMSRAPHIEGWQSKMHMILSGQVFPHEEGQNTQGRDTQFEMYLAAVFRAAGYEVHIAEPDVIVKEDEDFFGIAAKRLKSEKNIGSHISKASKQIKSSGINGIIALDISHIEDIGKPVIVNHMDAVHAIAMAQADGFVRDYMPRIIKHRWVNVSGVFAIGVYVTTRCLLLPDYKAVTGFRWIFANLCSHTDERCRLMNRFAKKLASLQV